GTLRCLGMKRNELLRWIVVEALMLALIGSLAGSVFGWLLAQLALVAVGETVGNLFSLIDLGPGIFTLRELGLSLASGLAVAVLAALYPALEAVRVSPLENARQTIWSPSFRGKKSWALRLGLICLLASPIIIFLPSPFPGPGAAVQCGLFWIFYLFAWVCFSLPPAHQLRCRMVLAMGDTTARLILGRSPPRLRQLTAKSRAFRHYRRYSGHQLGGDLYHRGVRQ